ncbi:MAG: 50S ribosomal protein L11 methyltransferase [Prevotella sp.]|nr:50S ribosomal protein L11 methyltransferase [Prevotella sp.]
MKYYEVEFTISPFSSDAADLICALAGDAGFETFEETETGVKGYVQQSLFSEEDLQTAIADFPFEGITVSYTVSEAEDRDWNEQWEQEGFEPIIIDNRLVIHDGRHLPEDSLMANCDLSIEIDAHLAFGTGTHETTRMVCATLLSYLSPLTAHLSPLRILDCGTGTGILSICALKLGAASAIGYDIDEWSVDNARHNAVINRVDDRFTSLLGDATILNKVEGQFDLVMANINRNILLADMPAFRAKMAPGARLILSGFYTADIPLLVEKAATLGLHLEQQKEDHDWACLVFC